MIIDRQMTNVSAQTAKELVDLFAIVPLDPNRMATNIVLSCSWTVL